MSTMVEKRVQMAGDRAWRLERLAAAQGTTPDALIEKALDLLFHIQSSETGIPTELRKDWELLQELDAEADPSELASASPNRLEEVPPSIGSTLRFDLSKGVVTHVVPVDPGKLRRFGEES